MTNFIGAVRALRMSVVAMTLLAAGCGSNSSTQQNGSGGVVKIDLMSSISSAIQQPAS